MPTVILILAFAGMILAKLYGQARAELDMLKPAEVKEKKTTMAPVYPVSSMKN